MLTHKAFKFRLYPTKEQAMLINKTIGCSRFVFNHFLNKRKEAYEQVGKTLNYNACSALLTTLKKEIVWLKEVDSTSLQSTLKDLDSAFKNSPKRKKAIPNLRVRRIQSNLTQVK